MNFEEKLKRLETIVQQMENPKKELGELIKLFKEGAALTKECRTELSSMENEVKKVMEEINTGSKSEPEDESVDRYNDENDELPF
ncbi:MAG: exodeoxyribonuclease VII small subunit [Deferribacteraceae bacterium]|jgi:exodeoxyribonuclease VII small subunit|nr:exodeoxyribonuclease VII small subunit [Deferribacteraceae bacterium]